MGPRNTLFVEFENSDIEEMHRVRWESQYEDDAGVDLCVKNNCLIELGADAMLGSGVRAMMMDADGEPTAFNLFPRSSIGKKGMMLMNSVGVIDSGYRGELMAHVIAVGPEHIELKSGDALVQICAPDLKPFDVQVVDKLDASDRGENGYGSTDPDSD